MRLPKPKLQHAPEVYEAIIREHQRDSVRMAERLEGCGWKLAEAAWAAVHWDVTTLAAAIANERAKRDAAPATPSWAEDDKPSSQTGGRADKKPPASLRPKKTTRIVRSPRGAPPPPKQPKAL